MMAWLTRLLLLVQALVATGIYFLATRTLGMDQPLIAAGLGLLTVVLVRLIIVGNNFLMANRFRSPLPAACRLNWRAAWSLYWGEARASLLASSWNIPFFRFRRRPGNDRSTLPVLLIHGYGCNSGYWHPVSKVLHREGITHHAVDMEPVFGDIDDYVPAVHEAIERLCLETGRDKVVIVAHSMGGLATRAYMRTHGTTRIAKAITLGTPHHGTALAQFGVGINTRQMHWVLNEQEGLCSEWLQELMAGEDPQLRRLFVSIYTLHDNIVSPQRSSELEGAKNIPLHGIGHVAMVHDATVQRLVVEEIRRTPANEEANLGQSGLRRHG